jgi:hypothetical protein
MNQIEFNENPQIIRAPYLDRPIIKGNGTATHPKKGKTFKYNQFYVTAIPGPKEFKNPYSAIPSNQTLTA